MEAPASEADCSCTGSSKASHLSQRSGCSLGIESQQQQANNMEDCNLSTNIQNVSRSHQPLESQQDEPVIPPKGAFETPGNAQNDQGRTHSTQDDSDTHVIEEMLSSITRENNLPIGDPNENLSSCSNSSSGRESRSTDVSGLSISSRSSGSSHSSASSSSSRSSNYSSGSSSDDSSDDTSSLNSSSGSSSVLTSSLSSFEFPTSLLLRKGDAGPGEESQSDDDSESSNDDDLANLISATMGVHGVALGHALAERASCIDSIKWLGQHLPETVLQFLIDEIEAEEVVRRKAMNQNITPSSSSSEDDDAKANHKKLVPKLNALVTGMAPLSDINISADVEGNYSSDPDEADSQDDTLISGPLHSQDGQEHEHHLRYRRRHSTLGGSMMDKSRIPEELSSYFANTDSVQVQTNRTERRASMPMIRRFPGTITDSAETKRRASLWYSQRDLSTSQNSDAESSGNVHSVASEGHNVDDVTDQFSLVQQHGRSGELMKSVSSESIIFEKNYIGVDMIGNTNTPIGKEIMQFLDPFPFDSDDAGETRTRLRERRMTKTKDSIRNLPSDPRLDTAKIASVQYCCSEAGKSLSENENYSTYTIPPSTRHDCALLFVDISGFTKLSTTLGVEPLSKTINSYFQKIVDTVESFGGDVLKFAGDALFAEWQATSLATLEVGDNSIAGNSQSSKEPWHGLGVEECVLTAATCGARIVVECSDFPVYESGGSNGKLVTTLNVHCGVGFGEVVGVHVGDKETRMEYLILGDPIEQVAEAIEIASRGEVVASPEALIILEESAILEQCILSSDMDKPQVIATKSACFFHPKDTVHIQKDWTLKFKDVTTKPRERLAKRCDDWDLEALKRLKQRISLYVHPVVVNDEFAMKVYPGDHNRAQERHRSEAELRGVFTVFIMPLITARLAGDNTEDAKVLILLNDIMLLMTRELARFKGQMRQFIVDDKGVVLIANFGLRGSTFPNMVAERAIPFTTTFQTLLKVELGTDCQMGATYGMAYCGVVGGVARHEYAVLGPSVNLAARLMANPINQGFLVDDSVKDKAGSRQFCALPPVKAKGYADLVPIFRPMQAADRKWIDISNRFVGREKELEEIVAIALSVIDCGGPSRFVLVSGEAYAGKSALCFQATKQIRDICVSKAVPHLILQNAFGEGDVFVPFSLARPIFLDILVYLQDLKDADQEGSTKGSDDSSSGIMNGSLNSDANQSLADFVRTCEIADIPAVYIDLIARLIVTPNRSDPLVEDDVFSSTYSTAMNSIAHYLVTAFLQCTIACDLVVLALDDVAQMDSMSWKVVQLLLAHSQNLMIIGTKRPMSQNQEMKANPDWWQSLHRTEETDNTFREIELSPLQLSDVEALVANSFDRKDIQIDPRISRDVFVQSGGMPHLASEIIENLYKVNMVEKYENGSTGSAGGIRDFNGSNSIDVGKIGELVLHRMDSLPSSVRTHLNLGAILGSSFELMDVISVFEQYRGVKKEERLVHAKSVHESLDEAVRKGILEVTGLDFSSSYGSSDHPYASSNLIYKFTHDVWRSNILRLTLDEWKRDMHTLIAQSMENVMDADFANDYRLLTKLFCHWKESGSAEKAATLALKMGRSLENIGLTRQALVVYHESFDMWKSMDSDDSDDNIGGLSMQLLETLNSSDLEKIIRLNVSLGRCYTQILDPKESIQAYQTALNFIHKAPPSADIVDRSIIFPVFSGLFVSLRFGHNEDIMYEQGLVRMFLRETKLFNDFHFARALAMQAEMLGRHGKFDLALQTVEEMKELYNVEEHSDLISHAYGCDRSGQCIAQCALWNCYLGKTSEALKICDNVLQDLLPHMNTQNISNSFQMLYPLIWVMKDNGRALEAKEAFHKYVSNNFMKLDERGSTSDRPLHMPIIALLDMIATSCETEQLQSYGDWIVVEKNGLFGSELNFVMGSCGRTADSITAEMCLLLANYSEGTAERTVFVRKGFELARDAIELTKAKEESQGMIVAYQQVKPIFEKLNKLHQALPPEDRSTRVSCRW